MQYCRSTAGGSYRKIKNTRFGKGHHLVRRGSHFFAAQAIDSSQNTRLVHELDHGVRPFRIPAPLPRSSRADYREFSD